MAVVTATLGATATPAVDLYDILATALAANANWTLVDTLTAANAGTTADCKVWKCTGGINDFFVCFENDNTNARIRVRAAENYETGGAAADRLRQPCGTGGSAASVADSTSVTPTANDTVTDSDITWGSTNPNVAYTQIGTAAAGFLYLHKVEDDKVTLATRSSSLNHGVVVGEFTPISTSYSDIHPLLMVQTGYNAVQPHTPSTAAQRCVTFSRCPGQGAVAQTGAFIGGISALHAPVFAAAPAAANNEAMGGYNNPVTSKFFSNHQLMTVAMVHHAQGGAIQAGRAFRGYLQDFIAGTAQAGATEPPVGDTIIVDGVTYYWLGTSFQIGAAVQHADPLLAVRA